MTESEHYQEAQELIENIYEYRRQYCPEDNIVSSILNYSFAKDISLQEIGDSLSEHKEFVALLEKQLIREHYFKGNKNDNAELIDTEW